MCQILNTDDGPDLPVPAPSGWATTHDRAKAMLLKTLCAHHTGRANSISANLLAAKLHMTDRLLRTLVSELREAGTAISATPDTGYFVAHTAEELEDTCAFLRSRALHSLRVEAQLRRIPMQDLLGQLRLAT